MMLDRVGEEGRLRVCTCMCVCIYCINVVIQLQTASQGKPSRHPVFNMLIRTHEAQ